MAVVWGFGPQHGRCEGYGKIGKMPLKKKTLGLATNGQKMSKTEKGQKIKMLRHQSVPAHGKTALDKPACVPAAHKVLKAKCPVLGHFGPKHVGS